MYNRMQTAISELRQLGNEVEAHNCVIGLFRMVLQHCCYSLVEWSGTITENHRSITSELASGLTDLYRPADGTLVSILADLLIYADSCGWAGMADAMFTPLEHERPAARIGKSNKCNLQGALIEFTSLRNEDVAGHGLPGRYDIEAELDLLAVLLERLRPALPAIEDSRYVLRSPQGIAIDLRFLLTDQGNPILVRNASRTTGLKCKVRAQTFLSLSEKRTFVYEAFDIVEQLAATASNTYEIYSAGSPSWSPLIWLPGRLTTDFVGRESEMNSLSDWFDDSMSHCCMIYGDGGYGKTTLVVEFLHQLLEGKRKSRWQPELITFFTAKKTAWGLGGLEHLKTNDQRINNLIHEVVMHCDGSAPAREWFNKTPAQLIDKLADHLRNELGALRDDHLVILDNTETLTSSQYEVEDLAELVRRVSRRLGRVILTTRRREPIEARQLHVGPLSEDEAIALLEARGAQFAIHQIQQAGGATKRKIAGALGYRPLAIDVFARALASENSKIEDALRRINSMMRKDLGAFLYDDAWNRLSVEIQHVLLILARISSVHDETILKIVCDDCGVGVWNVQRALDESEGIASITVIGNSAQVSLSSGFMDFCAERTVVIDGESSPTESRISTLKKRYTNFLNMRNTKVQDRLEIAFRHPYAKAAFDHYRRGDYKTCQFYYEQAIGADNDNAQLWDRYGFFLFIKMRDEKRALAAIEKAIRLDGKNPDFWFTRGLIEARTGDAQIALESLARALRYGKDPCLVAVQQAHAHLRDDPPNKAAARQRLEFAERELRYGSPHYAKTREEIVRLFGRAQ